eukprot:jgi/Astpho2/6314/Aster-08147
MAKSLLLLASMLCMTHKARCSTLDCPGRQALAACVAASLASHLVSLPELAHSARWALVADASKENLTAAWKQWLQDAVQETGTIPPGNAKGNKQWTAKRVQSRPEIKLTPGKGVQDLTCSVTDLVDQVIRSTKAVAFVKGTRFQPQCGFSYKVLSMLTELRADFEVVNVLDDQFNPGVRDAIKEYSQWPTIPQVYVGGEFLGGADIVEEMHGKGELKAALQKAGACISRAPPTISPDQDVKVNDGSKMGNAMGVAVLLSSVLAPAAAVAATRPLLEVAASHEVVSLVSSAVAIPAVTFGLVSMVKVMETINEAKRSLQDADLQSKAKQRHLAYLAEHPEEAQDSVPDAVQGMSTLAAHSQGICTCWASDAVQSASASAAHQVEAAAQTRAAASFAEGGQALGAAAAGASHTAGQGADEAVTEASRSASDTQAEHVPTAVADAAEQPPSLAALAAARERELAAATAEVVLEEAVTELAVMGATEAAHGGPQLHKPPPSSPWPPSLQRTPASPGRGSVSQAAAAVVAAPTAGAPAGAAQAGAAGAEAAAAATEALQAELAAREAEYAAKIAQLREQVRHEQAARPRSGPATGLATEAQQMAEEYEAKLAQVRQESAAKLVAQAQKAAQRDELVAALQAQRQRPQSPPSPAAATPSPAARTDKVSLWKRAQALIMSVWAWLVSAVRHRFGGSSKPRMA